MSEIAITGLGVLTPLADSTRALHQALCDGVLRAGPVRGFQAEGYDQGPVSEIEGFDARRYLGRRNLRPLDRTSRLAASAIALALEDASVTDELREEIPVGLVLGTMFCSVRTISAFDRRALTAGPSYASPLDFANTVINAAAGQAAIVHNLRGANSTVSTGMTSGLRAVGYAAELVRSGRERIVVAGGVDELCSESYQAFARSGRLAASANGAGPRPVPFERSRNGYLPSEGAALLVLETVESARARGVRVLARLLAVADGFDSSLGSDESAAAASASRTLRRALATAQLEPSRIDCVSASASGSPVLDRIEAKALGAVFGGAGAKGGAQGDQACDAALCPPITAIKSMTGEALGASPAIQLVDLLETLRQGSLPGIPGLSRAEEDLPAGSWSCDSRRGEFRAGLVSAVGESGHSAAAIVRAEPPVGVPPL